MDELNNSLVNGTALTEVLNGVKSVLDNSLASESDVRKIVSDYAKK